MNTNTDFGRETSESLTALLERIEKRGVGSLTDDQLLEFGRLYRRASSALSRARTHGLEGPETARLNRLVGRAYAHLYVGEPRRGGSLRAFFQRDLWAVFDHVVGQNIARLNEPGLTERRAIIPDYQVNTSGRHDNEFGA